VKAAADCEVSTIAKKVKEADDEARRTRQGAEETFDRAERMLSTGQAGEGCRNAIYSWELHEDAIPKAESAIRSQPVLREHR